MAWWPPQAAGDLRRAGAFLNWLCACDAPVNAVVGAWRFLVALPAAGGTRLLFHGALRQKRLLHRVPAALRLTVWPEGQPEPLHLTALGGHLPVQHPIVGFRLYIGLIQTGDPPVERPIGPRLDLDHHERGTPADVIVLLRIELVPITRFAGAAGKAPRLCETVLDGYGSRPRRFRLPASPPSPWRRMGRQRPSSWPCCWRPANRGRWVFIGAFRRPWPPSP